MFDFFGLSIHFLAIVFGLVEFAKKFGLKGRVLTGLSMALGVVLGVAHYVAQNGVPQDYAGLYQAGMFGLAVGLAASGFYDFLTKRFPPAEG